MDDRFFLSMNNYIVREKQNHDFGEKIHLASLVFIALAIYFSQNNIWSHINNKLSLLYSKIGI